MNILRDALLDATHLLVNRTARANVCIISPVEENKHLSTVTSSVKSPPPPHTPADIWGFIFLSISRPSLSPKIVRTVKNSASSTLVSVVSGVAERGNSWLDSDVMGCPSDDADGDV